MYMTSLRVVFFGYDEDNDTFPKFNSNYSDRGLPWLYDQDHGIPTLVLSALGLPHVSPGKKKGPQVLLPCSCQDPILSLYYL